MRVIILSGGSGSRLWPLSNSVRSKQFLKVLRSPSGEVESMLQRVYRQLGEAGISGKQITIATSQLQIDSIRRQLGDEISIVVEPERRNTFPAISLAVMHLLTEQNVNENDAVIVMPVDVYADQTYFECFQKMERCIEQRKADLVLMGIKPTDPSEKFGYIVAESTEKSEFKKVNYFVEKPQKDRAEELLRKGAYWNGGVFAFRLEWLRNILKDYTNAIDFRTLFENYHLLKKNSFDYEVVEKAANIGVVPYVGNWQDLGTWDTLTERMEEIYSGNVILGSENKNTHIINELEMPLIALGLQDTVVCATPDGILIADKNSCEGIKHYVTGISTRPMYEHRRWGKYTVLDNVKYNDGEQSLTKHLVIDDGKQISYQRHRYRNEIWIIVNGIGEVVINGISRMIRRGEVIYIKSGDKHSVKGLHELHMIEVQMGEKLSEEDIERFEME